MITPLTAIAADLSAYKHSSEVEAVENALEPYSALQGCSTTESLCNNERTDMSGSFAALHIQMLRIQLFSSPIHIVDSHWHGDMELRPSLTEPLIATAYRIAVIAHAGVSRKNGEPYINHPLRTAHRLRAYCPVVRAIALLHDCVEDSTLTLDDLRLLGIPATVISAVDALTKRTGEPYAVSVMRAASNPFARLVKLSDVLDNSSNSQLECFTADKREKQVRKYRAAKDILLPIIRKNNAMRKSLLNR